MPVILALRRHEGYSELKASLEHIVRYRTGGVTG